MQCGREGGREEAAKALQWAAQCGVGAGLRGPLGPASSLTGPVLSCPEALRCAQLGSAQCRARRGGSRPEAGSTWPRRPRAHAPGCCHLHPQGLALGRRPAGSLSALGKKKKKKNRRAAVSQAPRSADSGLPSALGGGKKKSGPSSHRIKLDLTSQQLKEVTALTRTLPGSQRAAGLEHRLWSVLEMIQRCKYFEKAEWKAEDTLGPYFS